MTKQILMLQGNFFNINDYGMQKYIVSSLEGLVINNPDFAEIERALSSFCPFEALGVVRHEIRHSNFLAYCLDPNRPHGFGQECLKVVMRAVARAQQQWFSPLDEHLISLLDFHLMDFARARIDREWKGVDLLVTLPDQKVVVAFELKIDAKEHSGQLQRYKKSVEEQFPENEGWRRLLVFLTKRGLEPSKSGEGWFPLELEKVARELDRVVASGVGVEGARHQLAAYLTMLRRHHLSNDRLDDLAAKLWSQHREALEFLMERSPKGRSGVFGRLYEEREQLAAELTKAAKTKVVPDDSTRTIIRFAVPEWDTIPHMLSAIDWTESKRLLLLELALNDDDINLRFVLGKGDPTIREQFYRHLEEAKLQSRRQQLSRAWTRIATETLVSRISESEQEPDDIFQKVIERASKYVDRKVPQATKALHAMAQSTQS